MSGQIPRPGDKVVLEPQGLNSLILELQNTGYKTIGPVLRNNAIVYDDIGGLTDLPQGWTDEQDAGRYRLKKTGSKAYFDFVLGPQSWKKYLQAPVRRLWVASRDSSGFQVEAGDNESQKLAFVGIRPCELTAISILDRILGNGEFKDPAYVAARRNLFTIAVNCGRAGATCFCASIGSGPKATAGFDLALTEVIDGDRHCFVTEAASNTGAELLKKIPCTKAGTFEIKTANEISLKASGQMGRFLDTAGLQEMLARNLESPVWEQEAARCLTCGNCTMVCPTCFCTTAEDTTDLSGKHAERWQRWDSCFTLDFSYIHGGSIRNSARARYRQMVNHKLGSWNDQFGMLGCVGCGRCITWCPAGIDITETVREIREGQRTQLGTASLKESKYANA